MSRAAVFQTILRDYVHNLSKVIESLQSEYIQNQDESNLTDNSDQKKIPEKMSSKYPERIFNFPQTNISFVYSSGAVVAGEVSVSLMESVDTLTGLEKKGRSK